MSFSFNFNNNLIHFQIPAVKEVIESFNPVHLISNFNFNKSTPKDMLSILITSWNLQLQIFTYKLYKTEILCGIKPTAI